MQIQNFLFSKKKQSLDDPVYSGDGGLSPLSTELIWSRQVIKSVDCLGMFRIFFAQLLLLGALGVDHNTEEGMWFHLLVKKKVTKERDYILYKN